MFNPYDNNEPDHLDMVDIDLDDQHGADIWLRWHEEGGECY
jgi:hypothetical protein